MSMTPEIARGAIIFFLRNHGDHAGAFYVEGDQLKLSCPSCGKTESIPWPIPNRSVPLDL